MSQTLPKGCESDLTVCMARLASLVSHHFFLISYIHVTFWPTAIVFNVIINILWRNCALHMSMEIGCK